MSVLRPTVSVMWVTSACSAGSRSCTVYSVHRQGNIVYRLPDFLCCHMNWGHRPPSPASECRRAILYIRTGSRKTERGGSHFARERGSHIIRQYSNYGTLYTMLTLQCTSILSLPHTENILKTHTFCCRLITWLHAFVPVIPSTYIKTYCNTTKKKLGER